MSPFIPQPITYISAKVSSLALTSEHFRPNEINLVVLHPQMFEDIVQVT